MNPTIKLCDILWPHIEQRIFQGTNLDYTFSQLNALNAGKPDLLLRRNFLARQIVRAVLDSENWIRFAGKEIPEGKQSCNAAIFSDLETKQIYPIVYQLRDFGFFDFYSYDFTDKGGVAFLSEFYVKRIKCSSEGGFTPNNQLRQGIREFISPFGKEEARYILPKS